MAKRGHVLPRVEQLDGARQKYLKKGLFITSTVIDPLFIQDHKPIRCETRAPRSKQDLIYETDIHRSASWISLMSLASHFTMRGMATAPVCQRRKTKRFLKKKKQEAEERC